MRLINYYRPSSINKFVVIVSSYVRSLRPLSFSALAFTVLIGCSNDVETSTPVVEPTGELGKADSNNMSAVRPKTYWLDGNILHLANHEGINRTLDTIELADPSHYGFSQAQIDELIDRSSNEPQLVRGWWYEDNDGKRGLAVMSIHIGDYSEGISASIDTTVARLNSDGAAETAVLNTKDDQDSDDSDDDVIAVGVSNEDIASEILVSGTLSDDERYLHVNVRYEPVVPEGVNLAEPTEPAERAVTAEEEPASEGSKP